MIKNFPRICILQKFAIYLVETDDINSPTQVNSLGAYAVDALLFQPRLCKDHADGEDCGQGRRDGDSDDV